MLCRKYYILFFSLLLFCPPSFSQKQKKDNDSIIADHPVVKDSLKKNNPKFLQNLTFLPSVSKKRTKVNRKPHLDVEGKVIRNINITTLDPFGYSDEDTTIVPKKWIEKTGNKLHLKSKEFAIRNYLLFKKNSLYEIQKIRESERLIRSQNFANSVSITEKLTAPASDSVDIYIRVLDSWSTIPTLSVIGETQTAGYNERNFAGLGHQFDYLFNHRNSDNKSINNFVYTIPTIKNTFIKTVLKYSIDLDDYYDKSINLERPFYSPLTKWAAGIYFNQQLQNDTLQNPQQIFFKQDFKFKLYDFWIGKAIPLAKLTDSKFRTSNLIVTARLLNIDYQISPDIEFDPIDFYASEKTILSGIGLSSRQYIEDQYIFKNGIVEDVPIARIYGITYGYQYKNDNWRPYIGLRYSFGNYYRWGFLSTNFETGTFFNNHKTEQSAFSLKVNYFTNLFKIGNWRIRQFVKPHLLIGANRKNSIGDRLTVNEQYGIQGFNSPVYGTKKLVVSLQTQSYAPTDCLGFRINPYFNYSIAFLGDDKINPKEYNSFSKIGVGLLITNDYLVFSSFQVSLSYYPKIPFVGNNIFRTNAFETTDFGLQSFELAKPKIELYK